MPSRKLKQEYEPCDFIGDLRFWGQDIDIVELDIEMRNQPEALRIKEEMDKLGRYDENLRLQLRKVENDFLQRRILDLREIAWFGEYGAESTERMFRD